jgi:isoleucyl-tRNA synthetase
LTPFLAESMHQNLYRRFHPESTTVHLEPYPIPDANAEDRRLEERMALAIRVVEGVRKMRQEKDLKVRQPLLELIIAGGDRNAMEDLLPVIRDEVNVKRVRFVKDTSDFVVPVVDLNKRSLGPKCKADLDKVTNKVAKMDPWKIADTIAKDGQIKVEGYELTIADMTITHKVKDGYVQEKLDDDCSLVLSTKLSDALVLEGIARDIVRRVQIMRKEMDLEYTQRILLAVSGDELVTSAVREFAHYIMKESQSRAISSPEKVSGYSKEWDIDGRAVKISIAKS